VQTTDQAACHCIVASRCQFNSAFINRIEQPAEQFVAAFAGSDADGRYTAAILLRDEAQKLADLTKHGAAGIVQLLGSNGGGSFRMQARKQVRQLTHQSDLFAIDQVERSVRLARVCIRAISRVELRAPTGNQTSGITSTQPEPFE
jgi:hypothetical protein